MPAAQRPIPRVGGAQFYAGTTGKELFNGNFFAEGIKLQTKKL